MIGKSRFFSLAIGLFVISVTTHAMDGLRPGVACLNFHSDDFKYAPDGRPRSNDERIALVGVRRVTGCDVNNLQTQICRLPRHDDSIDSILVRVGDDRCVDRYYVLMHQWVGQLLLSQLFVTRNPNMPFSGTPEEKAKNDDFFNTLRNGFNRFFYTR